MSLWRKAQQRHVRMGMFARRDGSSCNQTLGDSSSTEASSHKHGIITQHSGSWALTLSVDWFPLSLSLQHWEINWLRNRPGRSTTENGPIDRVERWWRCRSEANARRIGSEQQQLEITSGEYVVAGWKHLGQNFRRKCRALPLISWIRYRDQKRVTQHYASFSEIQYSYTFQLLKGSPSSAQQLIKSAALSSSSFRAWRTYRSVSAVGIFCSVGRKHLYLFIDALTNESNECARRKCRNRDQLVSGRFHMFVRHFGRQLHGT